MIRLKVDVTGKLDLSHVDANAAAMEGARAVYAEVLHSLDEMGRASQSRYFWPEASQSVTPPRLDGNMAVVLITKKGVRLHWMGERYARRARRPALPDDQLKACWCRLTIPQYAAAVWRKPAMIRRRSWC